MTRYSFLALGGIGVPFVNHIDCLFRLLPQSDIVRPQVLLQLVHARRPDDGRRHEIPVVAPREGQLGGGHVLGLCEVAVGVHGLLVETVEVPVHKPGEHVHPCVFGGVGGPVLAAQGAPRQGAVGQQPHAVVVARLRQPRLVLLAHHQRVAVLDRHDLRIQVRVGLRQHRHAAHAVGGLVRHPDVPDFARPDQLLQGGQLFLEGHRPPLRLPLLGLGRQEVGRPEGAAGVPVGPVDLQQIDVVDAEPRQRRVHRVQDLLARHRRRRLRRAPRQPVDGAAAGHLRGQDHVLALSVLQEQAHRLVGPALRLRLRRHGIHFGRVQKVDAVVVEGAVEERHALLQGVLFSVRHRAHTDLGDDQLRVSQLDVVHAVF
mmetsp:Transcript_26107/g.52035  ORF Transcript_26107/g.52035 Transcript_26107/m.52035 type:complete len:372 (-) Transcript_26107:136-1251(-)